MRDLQQGLAEREAAGLYRRRRLIGGAQGAELQVEGRTLLTFCSNDYLGLAADPRIAAALKRGVDEYGVGSGAAHLVCGHSAAHHALEEELAAFVGYPRALLFSTGYMANIGMLGALAGPGDQVFEDRLNHASLLDGGLLTRARLQRYDHASPESLAGKLATSRWAEGQNRLTVTDGVFSMDGDIAPLPELQRVCAAYDAWLMVDDAHGLGVLGPGGRGSVAHFGLTPEEVPVLMGTLGKGFGVFGAFVAATDEVIETLIQQARSYIYTTAMPPALAVALRESLRLVQHEGWRRERLFANVQRFRKGARQLGLGLLDSPTPIQPLLLGDANTALVVSQALEAEGLLVGAIRPPTVPEGSARLRITLSTAHDEGHIDRLLDALERVLGGMGLLSRPAQASGA